MTARAFFRSFSIASFDQVDFEGVEYFVYGVCVGQALVVCTTKIASGKQKGNGLTIGIDDERTAVSTCAERFRSAALNLNLIIERQIADVKIGYEVIELKKPSRGRAYLLLSDRLWQPQCLRQGTSLLVPPIGLCPTLCGG